MKQIIFKARVLSINIAEESHSLYESKEVSGEDLHVK